MSDIAGTAGTRPRWDRWLLVVISMLLIFGGVLGSAHGVTAGVARSTWGEPCSLNSSDSSIAPLKRCIAGASLSTRGYFKSDLCLRMPVLPGTIYPRRDYCGGRSPGPEAIEQARVISHLSAGWASGVDPNVQWELRLETSTGTGKYPDVLSYDRQNANTPVDVYELKQFGTRTYPDRAVQLATYVTLLNAVATPDVRPGKALEGWVDLFMIDTGIPCGENLRVLDVFIGWQFADGLFDIYSYRPPCFNPVLVPVPRPVNVPSEVGLPANLPNSLFGDPQSFPGRPWPGPPTLVPPPSFIPPIFQDPPVRQAPWDPNNPMPDWTCALNPACFVRQVQQWQDWFKNETDARTGGPHGEPHIVTLDGLHYDLQAVGEFEAARVDEAGVEVQARFVPVGSSSTVSMMKAVAIQLFGHPIEFRFGTGGAVSLLIDGAPYSLAEGSMLDFGEGAALIHKADGYYVSWPGTGPRPALWLAYYQFRLYTPPGTHAYGLLGDANGDPLDDLKTGGGVQLPATTSAATLHGSFAESWRIPDDESLFTYAAGESTETYTDRSFPSSILTIGDLSDSVLAASTGHCAAAGVIDGAPFDDCVLDWALTEDAHFVDSAATLVTPVVEGGARGIDGAGAVAESFDGSVAPNFGAPRYASAPGGGAFAGPFGHDGRYVFYVSSLPAHNTVTVQFDLVAIGDWATNASSNTVSLTIEGATAWTGAVATGTPSSTGTLPSGQPFAVYPVSVTVPSTDKQLNAGVSAAIPLGSSRALAVDNVRAAFNLVAPQSFNVTLPLTASDGTPAVGAGNLETSASEDRYRFSAPAGELQIDLSNCTSSLGYFVYWQLLADATGDAVASGGGCDSRLVRGIAAGAYTIVVNRTGASGTYALAAFAAPAPQTFNVTLPATIANGTPAAGAGNLETTASEDRYAFSTAADGKLQVDVGDCSSSLGYYVTWFVVDTATGGTVFEKSGCGSTLVQNLPAGQYRVVVTHNGRTGTYSIGIGLQPDPQYFNVSLPVSVSNGVPEPGAGNLETTASEDVYRFATTSAGGVQIDVSNCSSSLGYYVSWSLIDEQSGSTIASSAGCGSRLVSGVTASQYRVSVTHNGSIGQYALGILVQPPTQTFDVTPPVAVSPGVPATGAGNLETTASEDDYRFTTTTTKNVQIDVSNCSSSLGYYVDWKLVNQATGATVYSTSACGSQLVPGVPAGTYRVVVTRNGASGTYNLGIGVVAAPDTFNVTLPVTVSNGVPGPGAGNLETTSSEDRYVFTTTAAGGVQVDVSNCSSSLGYYVTWALVNNQTGASIYSTSACGSRLVSNVPAGEYRLVVTRNGATGTYSLGLVVQPAPQVFNVTLPVAVSNGVPGAGAGNLETTASEDDYAFTTQSAGAVQVDLANCGSSLGYYVDWKLVDAQSQAVIYSTSSCGSKLVTNVPAGQYKLAVTRNGATGTYSVGILAQPPPQSFAVTLPVSISNGVPASGAGNLETTASEDDYVFTTTSAGAIQVDLSGCGSSLGYYVSWALVNAQSGATVYSAQACSSRLVTGVPAGQYKLTVTRNGASGTYAVGLLVQPAPHVFDVPLPASISNGAPAAGAGNLETTASEDDYRFTTLMSGSLQLAFGNCASSLGYYVTWKLLNDQTGSTVYSTSGCSTQNIAGLAAGQYRVVVTRNGGSGTYTLGVTLTP